MRRWLLVGVVVLAACGGTSKEDTTADFTSRFQAGAPCQELFDIRNEFDPKSPRIETINEQLRSVGCFSSGSTRTD